MLWRILTGLRVSAHAIQNIQDTRQNYLTCENKTKQEKPNNAQGERRSISISPETTQILSLEDKDYYLFIYLF